MLQTDADGGGLLRSIGPRRPDLGVSKHHGYAFQWFALARLISGLYVWFPIRPPGGPQALSR